MRISDWSSDVCSSDLPQYAGRYRARDRKRRQEDDRRDRRWRQFPQMADRHPAGAIWRRLSSLGRRTHAAGDGAFHRHRSEEHTSELQSLMRSSYAVFCLKKKTNRDLDYNTYKEITTPLETKQTK